MYAQTYEKAVKQAEANAKTFRWMYVVFTDTSGRWQVEREDVAPKQVNFSYVAKPPRPEVQK